MEAAHNGDVSFWFAQIGGMPDYRPALPGNRQVDVCIIGAGFTGLWTAYYLKKHNPALSVAVVEREFAGFGASGRNGGWLSGSFSWNRERYLSSGTRDGVISFERAVCATVEEVIRVAEIEGIKADIRRTDELTVACSPAQMQRLQDAHQADLAWDVPESRTTLISASEVAERIQVNKAVGGHIKKGVARVQPAKLVRGLAEVVVRMGVEIWEQTAVTNVEKGQVTTDRGIVRADVIVRATEGYTAGLPGQSRTLLPLNSAIVVTEPIPDDQWDAIGWNGYELLGDASHGYCYAQRTADNRIAMGGRGVPYRFGSGIDTNGQTQTRTVEQLRAILQRLLPQTNDLCLDHAWCGVLGVPRDWCVNAGFDRESGMAWAGGYVGVGVSTSNLSGRTLADLILDRDTDLTHLPWVNRAPRKWEPEPLRWLGVHSMYHLYHMADRREASSSGVRSSRLAHLADLLTGH